MNAQYALEKNMSFVVVVEQSNLSITNKLVDNSTQIFHAILFFSIKKYQFPLRILYIQPGLWFYIFLSLVVLFYYFYILKLFYSNVHNVFL